MDIEGLGFRVWGLGSLGGLGFRVYHLPGNGAPKEPMGVI